MASPTGTENEQENGTERGKRIRKMEAGEKGVKTLTQKLFLAF